MGRKISNRLYSSFRSFFGLIISGILGRRCESLLWDFALWEKFLTRFLSIFVCFTPPLIFPELLKLARWNFHIRCIDDGANLLLSHSWLAFIGATEGGDKNGKQTHFNKACGSSVQLALVVRRQVRYNEWVHLPGQAPALLNATLWAALWYNAVPRPLQWLHYAPWFFLRPGAI